MKLPQSTEHEIQCQLVQWCEIVGVPIVAIPNGGHRHIAVAARMKREGVRAGFPDLFVPIAREGWHGLFVELKRERGGRVSASQKKWAEQLTANGYHVEVCHGLQAAIVAIADYCGIRLVRHGR
jgi:hypothetical protein